MKAVVRTDIGNFRAQNQDRAIVCESNDKLVTMALMCDGMGGHFGGATAAQIAIDVAKNLFEKWSPAIDEAEEWIIKCFNETKESMINISNKDKKLRDMGTTWTIALIYKDAIKVYNIGDSRCYAYNGLLNQITIDQNLMNHYIKFNNYSLERAKLIPNAQALIAALGPTKQGKPQKLKVDTIKGVKYVILTSDGVHNHINKLAFEGIFANGMNIDSKALFSIEKALDGGSRDNLTIIIVRIE